jgi:hypothetical protein
LCILVCAGNDGSSTITSEMMIGGADLGCKEDHPPQVDGAQVDPEVLGSQVDRTEKVHGSEVDRPQEVYGPEKVDGPQEVDGPEKVDRPQEVDPKEVDLEQFLIGQR